MNSFKIIAVFAAALTVIACAPSEESNADQIEREATKKVTAQAARAVGQPAITNFYEKRLLKEIYERRDQADLDTYAYVQGLDGTLRCLGKAVGYGVPYSTQYVNPQKPLRGTREYTTIPQPEPNGLFTPDGMSATWLQLVGPDGDVHVVYVEPTIVVSPFPLSGAAVAAGC